MRKLVFIIQGTTEGYESISELLNDVISTLNARGHKIDGAFYEVKSQTAYAWKEVKSEEQPPVISA